jgi:hypothetical protein
VARAAGANWTDAVALGNIAGGLEVEKFGCVPITPQEIIHDLLTENRESLGKQRTPERLLLELNRHRASGRKIVTVQPWVETRDGKRYLHIPPDAGYRNLFRELPPTAGS